MPEFLARLKPGHRVALFVLLYVACLEAARLATRTAAPYTTGFVPSNSSVSSVLWMTAFAGKYLLLSGICFLFVRDRSRRLPVLFGMLAATACAVVTGFLFYMLILKQNLPFILLASWLMPVLLGMVTGAFLCIGLGQRRRALAVGAMFVAYGCALLPISVMIKQAGIPRQISQLVLSAVFALLFGGAMEYLQRSSITPPPLPEAEEE